MNLQSNEVGGSYHMEQEGLIRCLKGVRERGMNVGVLVTDRHQSIQAYIKKNEKDITHYFDQWHLAKGKKETKQVSFVSYFYLVK